MKYPENPDVQLYQGKFHDGDPSQGIPASRWPAAHANAITDELIEVITYFGLTPSEGGLTQLRQAIQVAIANATPAGSTANKGLLELATQAQMNAKADTSRVPPVNVIATFVGAEIQAAINAVINGAPGAIDTLDELAAALGDDPNFATTITNMLAQKLNASVYTAADVLAKIKTVDGEGSGLDADFLDGKDSLTVITERWGAATTSGVKDWNHVSNTRPGSGYTLLLGSDENGPGGSDYFHAVNFEYSSRDGTGNVTQFAVPYGNSLRAMYMRARYGGTWSAWQKLYDSGNPPTPSEVGALASSIIQLSDSYNWNNLPIGRDIFYHGSSGVNSSGVSGVALHGRITNDYGAQLDIGTFGVLKVRGLSGGSWTPWYQAYTTNFKPSAEDVGALPIEGGVINGSIRIEHNSPLFILKDTNGTGADQTGYISLKDQGNVERGWMGYGSTLDTKLNIQNNYDTINGVTINGYVAWHAGNDGSGSGLHADLLDGQHGSYYYSPSNPPTPAQLGYSSSKTVNGYEISPEGVIRQWGEVYVAGNSTKTVTLPTPFPNAGLNSKASYVGSNSGFEDPCTSTRPGTTSFTVTNGQDVSQTISWEAIGH